MELLEKIKDNARKYKKRIVLAEGTEERTLQAADEIIREGLAELILIGKPADTLSAAEKAGLNTSAKLH